ncbi:MAG: PAS domain-containing protein, partial [Actinomycetota bacterium]
SVFELEGLRVAADTLGAAIQRDQVTEHLREVEDLHRTIVEQIPGVVYIETPEPESRLLYLSPQYETFFGLSIDERMADPSAWKQIVHPDDLDSVIAAAAESWSAGEPYLCEFRILPRPGEVRWVREQATLLREADGTPLHWFGLIIDITESRNAQEELDRTQERFRKLIEQIPVATYTESVDNDPERFYISPQIERITGHAPHLWASDDWWHEHIHPDDRERIRAHDIASRTTGGVYSGEYRVLGAEGRVIWIAEDAELIGDPADRGAYWQGTMADITERKQHEEELREAETRYRALVEQVPAITYQELVPAGDYEARGGAFIYISPQIEGVLGYSPEEFHADPIHFWDRLLHPDDYERVLEESIRATRSKQPYRQEYRMMAKDGRTVWIIDESVLVRDDPDTGAQVWHGVMVDITERHQAQERYRSLVEQIPAVVYVDREDPGNDVGWEMVYVSPQIEALTGFSADEWLSKDLWVERLHPEDRDEAIAY